MRKLFFRQIVCMSLMLLFSACAVSKYPGVIITGQNNHNWPISSQAIKLILDNTGMFETDIAVSPARGEDMSSFLVDFSKYKFVVLDYNGADWSEPMQKAFVDYVQAGGALVIYHASNNSFTNWVEYNKMTALGGWEGRTQASGPYTYWKDGGLVTEDAPGRSGSHGQRHEYVMNRRNDTHPIVKGLPEHWKHGTDELYDRMRGPGNIGDLLYTSWSAPETGGSGREEPLIFTVDYGKARIFHIMLGHAGESLENNPAMQCAGFQELLIRGTEWAVKGKVTRKVPSDFPGPDAVSLRSGYKPEN